MWLSSSNLDARIIRQYSIGGIFQNEGGESVDEECYKAFFNWRYKCTVRTAWIFAASPTRVYRNALERVENRVGDVAVWSHHLVEGEWISNREGMQTWDMSIPIGPWQEFKWDGKTRREYWASQEVAARRTTPLRLDES
jgi:hypothetical protein